MTEKIIVHAPAKINLFLHVIGKRTDGYHLLDSLVVFTEYGDVIEVEESDDLSLIVSGAYANSLSAIRPENNLVWKAALTLQKYTRERKAATIRLTKNLPLASGIGGGSADAAATIKALTKLWKLNLPNEELYKIALELGSDVPICLYGEPALMRGIGDDITPVELTEPAYIVLINPNILLATAEVFQSFSSKTQRKSVAHIDSFSGLTDEFGYGNDLEEAAISKLPIIAKMLDSLRTTKSCFIARMSGSGATCFALYHDKQASENALKELQKIYPQAWCVATHIL